MTSYVIRGGEEGKARLRIISQALWPSTLDLLTRAGIRPGMACLDVGCGGAPAVLAAGLATEAEIQVLSSELDGFARDFQTVVSFPRIFQVWAYRES